MSLRTVPGTGQQYHLICFDTHGTEVSDADGTSASRVALEALTAPGAGVTDVFIISHGWQGDLEDAIWQYDSWIGAANPDTAADGITPFLIGLHWPSKAWSDRELSSGPSGLLGDERAPGSTITVDEAVAEYAAGLGDSAGVRAALREVLTFVATVDRDRDVSSADSMPAGVADAYRRLAMATGASGGDEPLLGANWDPDAVFAEAAAPGAGSDGLLGGGLFGKLREALLTPLRQLTFWHSKNQAREFGEGGAAGLVRGIMARSQARLHLIGHSFGTIVVAGAVRGHGDHPVPPPRPVDSLVLVQGAVSLWAFAPEVPAGIGRGRGYFADVVTPPFVRGVVIATRTRWDYAVGRFYPLAVGLANQFLLGGDLPKFGGIGAFGIQGVAGTVELPPLAPGATLQAGLVPGTVHNIDASAVIATLSGAAGAHNDLAHSELSWLAWSAARASAAVG
ncbi:MAG TPA: hypothetical protein VFW55_11920 [Propionicimonas sp.]|nr:hypothetical protein [Propionicimonas sp.]